jgi:hypothetical protein
VRGRRQWRIFALCAREASDVASFSMVEATSLWQQDIGVKSTNRQGHVGRPK